MFDIGFQELIIIFAVALVVIGPQKIPEFSRTLGKWVNDIKKGIQTAKTSIEAEYKEQISAPENILKSDSAEETAGENNPGTETEKGKV